MKLNIRWFYSKQLLFEALKFNVVKGLKKMELQFPSLSPI